MVHGSSVAAEGHCSMHDLTVSGYRVPRTLTLAHKSLSSSMSAVLDTLAMLNLDCGSLWTVSGSAAAGLPRAPLAGRVLTVARS